MTAPEKESKAELQKDQIIVVEGGGPTKPEKASSFRICGCFHRELYVCFCALQEVYERRWCACDKTNFLHIWGH